MHISTIAKLALGGAILTVTACGNAVPAAVARSSGAATQVSPVGIGDVPGIGTVLTGSGGKTLYYFMEEAGGTVSCVGQCAQIWPPQASPSQSLTSVAGAPGAFGSVSRPDGTTQLTYATWPLYTFAKDSRPGVALGQGVNQFFVATPSLTPPAASATPSATAAPTSMPTPTPTPPAATTAPPAPAPVAPSMRPTARPTAAPTMRPTAAPTAPPTAMPSTPPTAQPTPTPYTYPTPQYR